MKEAKSVTAYEVKELQEETGEGMMACKKLLLTKRARVQKQYANEALLAAINLFNEGQPNEAFMELVEVVSHLVNK
jgi:hypothetical protein